MDSVGFLQKFREIFPPADGYSIISCVRQDPLIWQSLQEPEFAAKVFTSLGNKVELWQPAMLALLALGFENPTGEMLSDLDRLIKPDLYQNAIHLYEVTISTPRQPSRLEEAGLLAVALRERRRLKGSWQGLADELWVNTEGVDTFSVWQTPIACLLALVSDPDDLFASLAQPGTYIRVDFIRLIIHSLICNSQTADNRTAFFVQLLADRSPEEQIVWLEQLEKAGQLSLTHEIARRLAVCGKSETFLSDPITQSNHKDPLTDDKVIQKIVAFNQLASFHRLSGFDELATSCLVKACECSGILQAQLTFQLAQLAHVNQDDHTALHAFEQVNDLVPNSTISRLYFSNELINSARFQEAEAYLPHGDESVFSKFITAKLAIANGNIELARSILSEIADRNLDTANNDEKNHLDSSFLAHFARLLIDQGLADQAKIILAKAIGLYPVDIDLLELKVKADQAVGDVNEAIRSAYIIALLQPGDVISRKQLASLLEVNGNFQDAFGERKQIIASSPIPSTDDLLLLANCALSAGFPQVTISICKGVLANDPDNGSAVLFLGKAHLAQDDDDLAISCLKQATLLSPEEPQTWINLSQAYQKNQETAKALVTIRSAVNIIPESIDLHLRLGEMLANEGNISEAIPCFRIAYDLDPDLVQTGLFLAQALYKLGHTTEANEVLEHSRRINPTHTGLALLHGQILVNLDRHAEAWQAFQTGLEFPGSDPNALIAYGKTTLSLATERVGDFDQTIKDDGLGSAPKPDINKAITYVKAAVSIDPYNIEARLLLADLLFTDQKYQSALDAYLELSKLEQVKDPEWNWHLLYGQGQTSLKLGQTDAALISLREAASMKPDQLGVQHSLAEAYFQANLHSDCVEITKTVLMLAPQKLENLLWYSEMMEKLGSYPEAINGLETASQLSPERSDLLLRMAKYDHKAGRDDLALAALNRATNMQNVTSEVLMQAADLYTEFGDPQSTILSLEKALSLSPSPSIELRKKLTRAYQAAGDTPSALLNLQHIIDQQPANPDLYLWKAKLAIQNNHPEQALACLQEALSTPLSLDDKNALISLRLLTASLLSQAGNPILALEYIQKGLAEDPDDINLQSCQAELAFSLLSSPDQNDDHLKTCLESIQLDQEDCELKKAVFTLNCIEAETALEHGDIDKAKVILTRIGELAPEHPRVLAGLSRLAYLQDDTVTAREKWADALTQYNYNESSELSNSTISSNKTDVESWSALAIAEASFDLQDWNEALRFYQEAVRLAPNHLRHQVRLARALTLAAEHQRHCQALHVIKHAPGVNALTEDNFQTFYAAIDQAQKTADNPEVKRWYYRGHAAFQPTKETANALREHITDVSDAAAAAASYLIAGSAEEAVTLFDQYPESPEILFEKALALRAQGEDNCLAIAVKLVEICPRQPLYQALLAFSNDHDPIKACEAIELSLAVWPEEAQWHTFAAEKYEQAGDARVANRHWQEATINDPTSLEYKLNFAKSCYDLGEIDQAVRIFDQVTALDPSNYEAWHLAAEANRAINNLDKAFDCSEKASALKVDYIPALTLSGQIAYEQGVKETALQKAQRILDLDAKNADGILLYTRTLKMLGFASEALGFIEQSLQQDPAPFQCLVEKALLVRQVHGANQSLPYFQELAKDYPNENQVLSPYAEILIETGQLEAGEAMAQTSLQINSQQSDMHLLLGRLQRFKGQLDQSIYHLCEAIKLSPNQIEAYLELGRSYHDRREHASAIKTYRQATRIAPNDPRPYYHASLALKECKDYLGAETMLRYAARLAPDDLNIRRQLGAIIALNLVHNPHEVSIKQ